MRKKIETFQDLVEKEKEGMIFAKITKSKDVNYYKGGYYNYSKHLGQILDCNAEKRNSNGKDFENEGTTIEPLDIALGYFDYGDQITICNFTKLSEENIDVKVYPDTKPNCYAVSHVFVERILSLEDKTTVDYLIDVIKKETWGDNLYGCLGKLRRYNLADTANYLEERVRELYT